MDRMDKLTALAILSDQGSRAPEGPYSVAEGLPRPGNGTWCEAGTETECLLSYYLLL